MATLNRATRELTCKIVYYGPALGGKTTNLQQIHERIPSGSKGNLTSLATRNDRTLFFDLLPVDLGQIGDYFVKIQLYTVPGQVQYDATRRVVLKGVDGVVIVFDSDPEREDANYQSLTNLEENLASYKLGSEDVPTLFQYNKRDLDNAMSLDFMRGSLNPEGRFPEVEAVAIEGTGVMETVRKISSLVFARIEDQMVSKNKSGATTRPRMKKTPSAVRKAAVEKPEAPKEIEAAPDVESTATGHAHRIRQVGDVRFSGVSVGHAVLDVTPMALSEGLHYSARVEIHPLVGKSSVRTVVFRPSAAGGESGRIACYEASSDDLSSLSFRLWLVGGVDESPEVFMEYKTRLGKLRIFPEGRRSIPLGARGSASHG